MPRLIRIMLCVCAAWLAPTPPAMGQAKRHPGPWQRIQDTAAQKQLRAALKNKGKICFATNRDGNWDIYVTNPDGSGQTNLTKSAAWDLYPRWSPDGTRILFHSDRDTGDPWKLKSHLNENMTQPWGAWMPPHRGERGRGIYREISIYQMNADGSQLKKLVQGGVNACFSPDGKHIAFERDDSILILDLATGKTHSPMPRIWGGAWRPSFCPDGKSLLCMTSCRWGDGQCGGYAPTIFYLDENLRSTQKYWVLAHGGMACAPRWSPDGARVIYAEDTRGSIIGYVTLADWDKNELTPYKVVDKHAFGVYKDWERNPGHWLRPNVVDYGLDKDKHIVAYPAWSPDGGYFAFSLGPVYFDVKPSVQKLGYDRPWDSQGQPIMQELCVGKTDGTAWIQLTDGGYANRDADWTAP